MLVATAAPVTPISGNGPTPKIRHGPSTMLMALPIHSTRIATAASPAPRNAALIRNSSTIVALPPSITRVNVLPVAITSGEAPISASSAGAYHAPATPMIADTTTPSAMACTAALAAPSGSCSPMRRATIAVAPIDSPIASV